MSLRAYFVFSLAALVTLAIGSSVWAADVQGTYSGKIKCKIYDSTGESKMEDNVDILVHQGILEGTEDDLRIDFTNFETFALMVGKKYDDPKKPDKKANGGAVVCGGNSDPNDFNVVTSFKIKKADKAGARIKGTANFTTDDSAGECKYKAKRTSDEQPEVEACIIPLE